MQRRPAVFVARLCPPDLWPTGLRRPMVTAIALGLVIGAVMGGLGGGGGVLTVPALVYALGLGAQDATTASVVIVGIAAATGVIGRIRGRAVDWRTGFAFGAIGIPAAYLGTWLNQRVSEPVLLLSFAALTVLVAIVMLLKGRESAGPARAAIAQGTAPGPAGAAQGQRGATATAPAPARERRAVFLTKVVLGAAACGFLTGFLGVGGGFLVVPVLVIVLRMPMSMAVGTSLLVIVLNAVSSLVARIGALDIDWVIAAPFTIAAVVGGYAGKLIADRLSGATLTRAFAVVVFLVGAFVAVESLISL